jgi:hypothetical protein
VLTWGALGLVGGLGAGFILVTVTERGGTGFWMLVIAPAIFFGGVSAFVAGIASLESPQPGNEPSQTDAPLRNDSTIVVERNDPIARSRRDTPD